MAYGILVPQPGIAATPPEVEAQSLNQWSSREFSELFNVEFYFVLLIP